MRKYDLYWRSNKDWWEFKNHIPVIRKDAPEEAQESYRRFLQQVDEEDDEVIQPTENGGG